MNEDKKESFNSVADQVEKSVKEKSANAENFVRHALDNFEDLIFKLIAIRPKDYQPRDFTPTRDYTPTRDFTPTKDFTPSRDFIPRKEENKN